MFKLDDNFLKEIGLGELPTEQKPVMLKDILDTLELRVGMKLAERMSDAQLDEFESLTEKKDDALALKWLETNFPNYKEVVVGEMTNLKEEIKASAPQIIEISKSEQAA